MAKLKNNVLVKGFSGRLGDIIFKNYKFGTVISRRPNMSKVKRTRQQKENSNLFAEAVEHARNVVASPALKNTYEKKAKKTGRTVYHLALSEFMAKNAKPSKGKG